MSQESANSEFLENLKKRLPREPLGNFPTPVRLAEPLSRNLGVNIWIKEDGAASEHYGGNKVRKLEFLLADAKAKGAKRILTFGGVGSHHAIACAVHAARVGLGCDVILVDQPLTPDVHKSLLLAHHFGARTHYCPKYHDAAFALPGIWRRLSKEDGVRPYFLPPGGSVALGSVGYALAALEIQEQIADGVMPRPEAIFLAVGSCGTLAGLLAGSAICKLGIPLKGVRVVDRFMVNRWNIRRLAKGALSLLDKKGMLGQGMPFLPDFELLGEFFGAGYGAPTRAGEEALRRAREEADLRLELTYTAKAFAALLVWAQRPENSGKNVLFWNTHSSADFSKLLASLDWRDLPAHYHKFFDGTIPMAKPS